MRASASGSPQPREEVVEGIHQRAHLGRDIRGRDRVEGLGGPAAHGMGESDQRTQLAGDGKEDERDDQRQQEEEGADRAQRCRCGEARADGRGLGDCDGLPAPLQREDAPLSRGSTDGRQPGPDGLGDVARRVGRKQEEAVAGPYPDDEVETLVRGEGAGCPAKIAAGERTGDLLQMVVEHRIRFLARRRVGRPGAKKQKAGHDGDEDDEELAADRFHGVPVTSQPTPRRLRIIPWPSLRRRA